MELKDTVEMMNSSDYKERLERNISRLLFAIRN